MKQQPGRPLDRADVAKGAPARGNVTMVQAAPASQPARTRVSGIVVTPDDRPVAGATVYATSNDWPTPPTAMAIATTDATGKFATTVPQGRATDLIVDVAPWGYSAGNIAEDQRAVRGALAELPEAQRTALALAYSEGLSQSEIAARLSQPLGTIKTRMQLGMKKMRERLGAYA